MANEIFISYKTEDKEIVKDIKNAIDEKLGAGHCWMDIDGIETGVKDYESPLYKAIQNSSVFLFMISDRSVDSEFCLDELDWAIEVYEKDENKHLVFVLIDPNYQLKGAFKRNYIQRRDIIDYNDSDRFAKLIRDLRKWLDIPEIDPLDDVRKKVEELKADYNLLVLQQETIDKEIREQQKLLGETENECPVCGKTNEVEAQYCKRCGYILNYFAPRSFEDTRLRLLRLNWASNREAGTVRSQNEDLKKDLAAKDEELMAKEDLLLSKQAEIQTLESELKKSQSEYTALNEDLTKKLQLLTEELQKTQSEYAALKQKYDEDKKYIEEAKKKEKEEEPKRLVAQEYSYDVVLKSAGASKLQVALTVKENCGLGLKEAKELVDAVPATIKEGVDKATAEALKVNLESEGAKIEIIGRGKEAKSLIVEEEKRKASREFTVNGIKFKMIYVEGCTFQEKDGGWIGAGVGAAIGSIVLPVVGTVAGAYLGKHLSGLGLKSIFGSSTDEEKNTNVEDNDKSSHSVTLGDFMIGETEVTQELWKAVMGNNPSYFNSKSAKNPVERVCWSECKTFIEKLNKLTGQCFRLPTNIEWEYAACGGQNSQGTKYAGSDYIDDVAWYDRNSNQRTHPVKTKQPNELGLYDMNGNVWEWCEDRQSNNSPQANPKGTDKSWARVCRGGSWFSQGESCQVTSFLSLAPNSREKYLGFRLAL